MVAKNKSSNAHPIMNTLRLLLTLGLITNLPTSLSENIIVNAAKLK